MVNNCSIHRPTSRVNRVKASRRASQAAARSQAVTSPPPRRRRKEARPQEIADAAVRCFVDRGYAATTVADIAREAGVAKGTVYVYFPTKEALFEEAVRSRIAPVFKRVRGDGSPGALSASDRLRAIVARVYQELVADPQKRAVLRVLIAEGARFPQLARFYHEEIVSGARQTLADVLRDGVASGEFRDTPAAREPRVVMGPVVMAAVWKLTFDDVAPLDLEAFCDSHLDLVLGGLLATPAPPSRS